MSRVALLCLCLIVLGCAARNSVDYRNFAIDTYFPKPHDIQVAEASARKLLGQKSIALWAGTQIFGGGDVEGTLAFTRS